MGNLFDWHHCDTFIHSCLLKQSYFCLVTVESWVGVYTVKDCYPVQETYTKNYSVTTSTRFFDLQLGIADPSVFTPPSTCQTAQLRMMKDECWLWTLAALGKQILAKRMVINSQLLTSNLIFQAYCCSFGNFKFSLGREHKHLNGENV